MNDKDFMRFITKVKIGDGCWEWTAYRNELNRGIFVYKSKNKKAHRISYRIFVGEILDGLEICHRCNNPACVRPSHLYAGTHKENMKDEIGRKKASGENNGHSRFANKDIVDIRRMFDAINPARGQKFNTCCILANMYDCSPYSILHIVDRRTWKHVK